MVFKKKEAGGVAQVVEHLRSKSEALSSTPIPPRRRRRSRDK
jgi:hypothetical protein